jgi:nucleotide-binding universal stress UspA family protein
MALHRILVPVDFSHCSEVALELAVTLAKGLGASIDVLHVWQTPDYVAPEMLAPPGSEQPLSFGAAAKNQARRRLEQLAQAKGTGGVTIGELLEFGDAYATILERAEHGYDIIVMGTHGRSGFRRLAMGSLAEKVVRSSPCPVLTVPEQTTPEAAVEEAAKLKPKQSHR